MSSSLGRLVIAVFILQPALEQCCLITEPQNIMKLSASTIKEGSGLCLLIMIKLQGLPSLWIFTSVLEFSVYDLKQLKSLHLFFLQVRAKQLLN